MKKDESKNLASWLFITGYALIGMAAVALLILWKRLPPELPWLYSLPWGEKQLISKLWFALGLLVMSLIYGINGLISKKMVKISPAVQRTVLAAGLLMIVMYLMSFFKVLDLMS